MLNFKQILVVLATICVAIDANAKDLPIDTSKKLDTFVEVFERVRLNYVEEISGPEIMDKAISGMLSGLDPHSS